jgi:hypothetical protein
VNFEIIPTDKIVGYIFKFSDELDFSNSTSSKYSGFASKSILKNLGFILFGFMALTLAIIFIFILKCLMRKFPILRRPYTFISRRIFFNGIIRSLFESYLKLSLSTFITL